MRPPRRSRDALGFALAAAGILLAGCTALPTTPTLPNDSHPSGSPRSGSTQNSPAATPPTAEPVTCANILTDEAEASLTADGMRPYPDWSDGVETDPNSEWHAFYEYGGVVCMWGPEYGSDIIYVYAASPITPAQTAAQEARLSAAGYVNSFVEGKERWQIPAGADIHEDTYEFDGSVWRFALYPDEISQIAR